MARTQAVTILFCDLVRSTERRARLGDDAFDQFTKRFMGELRAAIAEYEGREVSSAGDGLMAVFPDSVADGLECAASMHRRVARLDADDPPLLRIGISCGEVAQDGDEYSGMPIVEAARLEASAQPGRTLANAVVRSLVGTRRAFRFRDVGRLTLKGIPEPLATVEIVGDTESDGTTVTPTPVSVPAGPAAPPRARGGRSPVRRRGVLAAAAVLVVVALVVAGLAIAGGGSGSTHAAAPGLPKRAGYTPRYTAVACAADVRAAAPAATCGHLVVPEDRSKPQGKQVTLLVTRAPPRVTTGNVAPSIDLCGCESVANSIVRDHAELIGLTARGYPGSEPTLTCPEMSAERTAALTKPANDPDEVARGAAALAQCHTRLVKEGIDPAQYNSKVGADDALDLMIALHIGRADFTASGEVSAELFEIVRRAPGVVRSITIDDPAPPGHTELSDPVSDLAVAFGRFVARCKADARCAAGYPDLEATWKATYARYESTRPVVAATNLDDSTAPAVPVLLDGPRVADALAAALMDSTTYKLIPTAISSPAATAVVASQYVRSDFGSFNPGAAVWGTIASYVCAYDAHTVDTNALALEASTVPQFTRALPPHWITWCKAWKVPDVSGTLSTDLASPVPALLFRGDLQPLGSDDWLRRVQRGLSRDQTVTFSTLGGDLLANGPPCLSALRRAFLANPTAKLDTAVCAKQSPPIAFVAPG